MMLSNYVSEDMFNFRILPDVYLHCKSSMLTESRRNGRKLRLTDTRKLCRIDVNKTRKIYNCLVK